MKLKLMVMFVLLPFGLPTAAAACSCVGPGQSTTMRQWATESAQNADAIFVGEPIAVEQDGRSRKEGILVGRHFTFLVKETFKGGVAPRVGVFTGWGGGDCGLNFEIGVAYLVYAHSNNQGELYTGICSFTQPLQEAGIAVRQLRGEPPAPEDNLTFLEYLKRSIKEQTGVLCGRIARADGTETNDPELVTWKQGEGRWEESFVLFSEIKPDGSFRLEGLEPGLYVIGGKDTDEKQSKRFVGLYGSAMELSGSVAIPVKAGSELNGYDLVLRSEDTFAISGRIALLPGSRQTDQTTLGVHLVPLGTGPFEESYAGDPLEEGDFEITGVAPGRYRLRAFYWNPAIQNRSEDAEVEMEISVGGNIHGLVLALKPRVQKELKP